MKAYKLIKVRKDGSLGPLFIDAKKRLPVGKWMNYQAIKRKGFAFRPGFHCTAKPIAPHLKKILKSGEIREWWEVEIEDDAVPHQRPREQGGLWFTAKRMKLIRRVQ
jgi:hypothetical protein